MPQHEKEEVLKSKLKFIALVEKLLGKKADDNDIMQQLQLFNIDCSNPFLYKLTYWEFGVYDTGDYDTKRMYYFDTIDEAKEFSPRCNPGVEIVWDTPENTYSESFLATRYMEEAHAGIKRKSKKYVAIGVTKDEDDDVSDDFSIQKVLRKAK